MQQKKTLQQKLTSFIKRKTSQKYKFNLQFENNRWDDLRDPGELGRYSIIVGFTHFFCRKPRILDLGCGEGILQERFAPTDYTAYLGIDFSDVAIAKAGKLKNARTDFRVGDLNELKVEGIYDAIIYNESLNYLSKPQAVVQALFPHLSEGGVFIFSLVDKHGKEQTGLWQQLGEILDLQEASKVVNRKGHIWTIQVYKVRK